MAASNSSGNIIEQQSSGESSWSRRIGSFIANTFKSLINRKRPRMEDDDVLDIPPTTRRRRRSISHSRQHSTQPEARLTPHTDMVNNDGSIIDIESCLPSYHLYLNTFPGPTPINLDTTTVCRRLSLGNNIRLSNPNILMKRRASDPAGAPAALAILRDGGTQEQQQRQQIDDLQLRNDILTSACLHSLHLKDHTTAHSNLKATSVERWRQPNIRFRSGVKDILAKKDKWQQKRSSNTNTQSLLPERLITKHEYTLDEYRQAVGEQSAASEGYIVRMEELGKQKNDLKGEYDRLKEEEKALRAKKAPQVAATAAEPESPTTRVRRPSWMILTEEESMDARALLCRTGPELLAPEKYNIDITAHSIACLQEGRWLNDEVVNYYFMMLQDRSDRSKGGCSIPKTFLWNSFFWQKLSSNASGAYDYKAVSRWSKRRKADIFSFDRMIVPIHVGKTHWALGVVDLKECTLSYYDSLGASHPKFYDYISRYIEDEHKDKKSKVPLRNPNEWQRRDAVITPSCIVPRQNNSNDCGVFMCMFAEAVSGGRSIVEVTQDIIPDMRYKMVIQISSGYIPGPND